MGFMKGKATKEEAKPAVPIAEMKAQIFREATIDLGSNSGVINIKLNVPGLSPALVNLMMENVDEQGMVKILVLKRERSGDSNNQYQN